MTKDKSSIAYGRIVFILFGLLLFLLVLVFGESLTKGNIDALRILVMAFSILAGVLIAIITAFGEPRDLIEGSWRIASIHRRSKISNIYRCVILFYIYLSVVSMIFISALLNGIECELTIARWVERITLSAGVAALFWSFGLPKAILGIQRDRLNREVDRRRKSDDV